MPKTQVVSDKIGKPSGHFSQATVVEARGKLVFVSGMLAKGPDGKIVGLGLISAVTNKGELRWMVLDGAVTAPALIRFLGRLIRDAGRKVFLVLDRLPVHRSAKLRAWLAGREAEIEVFHLPPYSPDLNPDEGLNADLKQAVTRKAPARGKPQLKRAVVGHMRRLSRMPKRIRSYFQHPQCRYAA